MKRKGEIMTVNFYEDIDDKLLKFAVIVAVKDGKYIFCKHKLRETLEIPGGHREPGEMILIQQKGNCTRRQGRLILRYSQSVYTL